MCESQPSGPVPIPRRLAKFRQKYRETEIGAAYSGVTHLSFVVLGSLTVIVVALSYVQGPISALEWTVFGGTFIVANFVEYVGHRLPMHNRLLRGMIPFGLMFHRHTGQHHNFFTEEWMTCRSAKDYKIVLFPPVMLFVYLGLVAAPIGIAHYLLLGLNAAMLCVTMAMLYFLQYELLHFCYHLDDSSWVAQLPVLRKLREHHRVHHALDLMNDYNFNITWPIADFVFGTTYDGEVPSASKTRDDEHKAAA